jgi:hypothetical protein
MFKDTIGSELHGSAPPADSCKFIRFFEGSGSSSSSCRGGSRYFWCDQSCIFAFKCFGILLKIVKTWCILANLESLYVLIFLNFSLVFSVRFSDLLFDSCQGFCVGSVHFLLGFLFLCDCTVEGSFEANQGLNIEGRDGLGDIVLSLD